ncbi:MAG: hypothetical protein NUV82_04380 [Candidatus Komeilibacteria bacterium]|nr:hypothetical protein [Candidatus Komeilibacteria bacterium]
MATPLSALQKYILLTALDQGRTKVNRGTFIGYYRKYPKHVKSPGKVLAVSVDRLIARGLLTGYGEKTRTKLFIREVRLTPLGRRLAKKLQGEQKRFTF